MQHGEMNATVWARRVRTWQKEQQRLPQRQQQRSDVPCAEKMGTGSGGRRFQNQYDVIERRQNSYGRAGGVGEVFKR
jgi:hypothetical protein